MKSILTLLAVGLACATLHAAAGADRWVQKIKWSAGFTAVVAEGDWEARSTGSYGVRVYSTENAVPGDDTTFFVAGLIRARDGSVEAVKLADIDGDGKPELVVTVRNAGSGSYLSADAYAFDGQRLWLRASVADLAADADPIAALKLAPRHKA
jgi:hypothetical protein